MKIPNEQMVAAYKGLPQPIREFLSDPAFGETVQAIGVKFTLHLDTQGELAQMVTNILLGFLAPTELRTELVRAGIPESQTPEIIQELNSRIFQPIQKSMREGQDAASSQGGVDSEPVVPINIPVPITVRNEVNSASIPELLKKSPAAATGPVVISRPMNVPVPPAPKPVPPPAPPIPTPAPVPAPAPTPAPAIPAPFAPVPQAMPASAPIYVSPEAAQPAIRTMAHDMEMLKEGEKHPHPPTSLFGPKPTHTLAPIATPTPVPTPAPIQQPAAPEIAPVSTPSPAPAAVPQPISWQPSSPARSFQTSSVPNTLAAPSMHPAPMSFAEVPGASAPQAPMPIFHAPAPQQVAPAPEHPPIPAPSAPVPHNLPTQPAAYPWQSQSSAAVVAPTTLSPEQRPQAPIIKEYGVDPYRETPE